MKKLVTKYNTEIIGFITGAAAGWSYWYFFGCASGTCAITSDPFNSAFYGAIMGALVFGLFPKKQKEKQNEHKTKQPNR